MTKKLKQKILAAVALILVFSPVLASADVSQTSVAYLKAATQTPWTTMALAAAGASDIATSHLQTSDNKALEYAKNILALTAVGQNPYTFGNVDYVTALSGKYQDGQIGDPQSLMDDSFGILALAAGGISTSEDEIANTKNYLLSKQNTDGGWGYNVGVGSDTNSTAVIIMALVEAGVTPDNQTITSALNYLTSAQNNDGGWGWSAGSDSDADSTSWVAWAIKKVGQNPSSWQKNGQQPLGFIQSLQNTDGSFGRMASNKDGNLMTTYNAVIALAGKTLPLGYFSGNNNPPNNNETTVNQYRLRIEGPDSAICDKMLSGNTAYDLLVAGQAACNYTFAGNSTWGSFFIDSINGIVNNNPAYWMYLVNNQSAQVGLDLYHLVAGDEVLIYYDTDTNVPLYPDYDRPLKITLSNSQPQASQTITAKVEYYNQTWQPLAGATVFGADKDYQTDASGQVSLTLPDGYYTLYAEKPNYIRSNQTTLMVGDGISQNVGLTVDVSQGGHGQIAGESIIFEVLPNQLNFGQLEVGKTASSTVTLTNAGTVNLKITAAVSGDNVFTQNIRIDGNSWSDYQANLNNQQTHEEGVSLFIPSTYIGSGVKTGELIFWAQAQ